MIKFRLSILCLIILFYSQAKAGETIDISGTEEKHVTKFSAVKFVRQVGDIKYKIKLGGEYAGVFNFKLKAYKNGVNLINQAFTLKKGIIKRLGFSTEFLPTQPFSLHDMREKAKPEISSDTIKSIILNTPLKDLFKDSEAQTFFYSFSKAHNKVHDCERIEFSCIQDPKKVSPRRTSEEIKAKLGLEYTLADHLVDLSTFFILPDPNSIQIQLLQGSHNQLGVRLNKDKITGTYQIDFHINFYEGPLRTFSFTGNRLQDGNIRHLLDTSDTHDELESFNVWSHLMATNMRALVGEETLKVLVNRLTKEWESTNQKTLAVNYNGISADVSLERFCTLVNLTTGVNKLATWSTARVN